LYALAKRPAAPTGESHADLRVDPHIDPRDAAFALSAPQKAASSPCAPEKLRPPAGRANKNITLNMANYIF
jgi:hypothetical protein